jgi:hypothetical protein
MYVQANKPLESVTPGFRFEVLPKKMDSRRQAQCRDGARGKHRTGKRSSRSQKGRGSAAANDAAQDWGFNSRQPTAREVPASATDMAIGCMLEELSLCNA